MYLRSKSSLDLLHMLMHDCGMGLAALVIENKCNLSVKVHVSVELTYFDILFSTVPISLLTLAIAATITSTLQQVSAS